MKEIFELQRTVDADLGSAALTAAEAHAARVKQIQDEQVERLGLPPVPEDGSIDPYSAMRVYLAEDSGQFTGERRHGQPGDPGYVG